MKFKVAKFIEENEYFSIGLAFKTWFAQEVAVQISGLCPSANKVAETDEFDDNASGFVTARGGNDSDGGGSMGKSSVFTSSKKQRSKKKYQTKVEIRSANQEILDLLRSDFENFVSDLT